MLRYLFKLLGTLHVRLYQSRSESWGYLKSVLRRLMVKWNISCRYWVRQEGLKNTLEVTQWLSSDGLAETKAALVLMCWEVQHEQQNCFCPLSPTSMRLRQARYGGNKFRHPVFIFRYLALNSEDQFCSPRDLCKDFFSFSQLLFQQRKTKICVKKDGKGESQRCKEISGNILENKRRWYVSLDGW